MSQKDIDDKAFEELAHDLEMITGEFMENYNITPDEMHGLLLAQIVRFYIDHKELDHAHGLLSAVLQNIEEKMDEGLGDS